MQLTVPNALVKPYAKFINFVSREKVILTLWTLLALYIAIRQYFRGSINNNYLIFKYTFIHALERLNLYNNYDHQYLDTNHYGPFFTLVIAPFAQLPDYFGMFFWQMANILFLYFAVKQLPIAKSKIIAVYWIITHEVLTAMFGLQFNNSIAAIIILSFVYINQGKNFWATFLIFLGAFIKLYGIVGLAFFFFVKDKKRFILYSIFWCVVFFVLPMLFFSPSYIIQCYYDWFDSLANKQNQNASLTSMQDRCVMGIVRRVTGDVTIPNLPFIIGGMIIFAIPYLRISQYKEPVFRLLLLASTMIFAVIFSNSSESPTYVIAFVGVAVWFVVQENPKSKWATALLIFALLVSSFYMSDIFPRYVRKMLIEKYSLKALPVIFIWLVIVYQQIFKTYTPNTVKNVK